MDFVFHLYSSFSAPIILRRLFCADYSVPIIFFADYSVPIILCRLFCADYSAPIIQCILHIFPLIILRLCRSLSEKFGANIGHFARYFPSPRSLSKIGFDQNSDWRLFVFLRAFPYDLSLRSVVSTLSHRVHCARWQMMSFYPLHLIFPRSCGEIIVQSYQRAQNEYNTILRAPCTWGRRKRRASAGTIQ